MNCVFFTKPKDISTKMLDFLIQDNRISLIAVILYEKERFQDTPFFELCKKNGIDIVDYSEADALFQEKTNIDVIYCSTFPRLIKGEWINRALIAAINFHTAPLPDYRGVFAFNFAIYNGDTKYGVTCHHLSSKFDTGDIVDINWFPYDCAKGNIKELVDISNEKLFELFKSVNEMILRGEKLPHIVQEGGRYYSRSDFERLKIVTSDMSSEEIERRIRAFWYPPYEGAYIMLDNKKFELLPNRNELQHHYDYINHLKSELKNAGIEVPLEK